MTVQDFWKKAFIVFLGIFIFRIGSHLPVPGIDPTALSLYVKQFDGTMIELLNTFSGGSVKRFSVLAVGIMPYISASIIIQMFGFFNEHLKQLKSEGERGQLKLNQYTRYLALLITFGQAFTITNLIASQGVNGMPLVKNLDFGFYLISILSLTTGTMFLLWLGERLTEHGIGSGVSIIIFAGIISGMPETISQLLVLFSTGEINRFFMLLLGVLFVSLFYIIVLIETSQRRIKLSSSNSYSDNSYLPIKINISGIMPAIFASTILFLPLTVNQFFSTTFHFDFVLAFQQVFGSSPLIFLLSFSSLIMFFSFFYAGVVFSPKKTADNLQASGAFIKGIRPGKPTEMFIAETVKRLTLIGGSYIVLISLLPEILVNYFSVPFYFGGTSMLIMVLIAKEWLDQYEMSQHSEKYVNIKNSLMDNFK